MNGLLRIILLGFFISHIPITMMMDGQGALPISWYPKQLVDLRHWYVEEFGDSLMNDTAPVWFQSIILGELVLQLPFFFFAVYALLNRCNWIRTPGLLYGAHVCTTMIPIIGEMLFSTPARHKAPLGWLLPYVYAPYLFIPLIFIFTLLPAQPFGPSAAKSNKGSKRH